MSAPESRAARKAATKASPAPVVSIASIFGALTRQRLSPCSRLAAGRAALDDDQRVAGGESRALGFGIDGAGENRGFLFVGEQDRRASRPCEKFVGADLAQEFRRGRIDADRLVARAPHDIENGRARRRGEERIAGEMDERRALDQRVRDVAGFERFVGAAVGEEAAFAVGVDEGDEPPGLTGSDRRRDAA